jgi:hypothetical protein
METPAPAHPPLQKLPGGWYCVSEADGQAIWGWITDLNGAPLKPCSGTKILDSVTKGCSNPPILVTPPVGVGAKLGAKLKARRPNDRKQLTQAGGDAEAGDCARCLGRDAGRWLVLRR